VPINPGHGRGVSRVRRFYLPPVPQASVTLATYTLTAGVGAFVETGSSANLLAKYIAPAALATFVETGIAAVPKAARIQPASVTTYLESGIAAALLYGRTLGAALATFLETGYAAGLIQARIIGSALGIYTVTGNDAAFVHGGSQTMVADVGVFTVAGNDANLVYSVGGRLPRGATYESPAWHHHVLRGERGRFAAAAGSGKLRQRRGFKAASGILAIKDMDARLLQDRGVRSERGRFTTKATPAIFRAQRILTLLPAEYLITGNDARLEALYLEPPPDETDSDDDLLAIIMAYEMMDAA
jgi:hypothetical protein